MTDQVTPTKKRRIKELTQSALSLLTARIVSFDFRHNHILAVSRTLLVVAQLSILIGTPTDYLFASVGNQPPGPECEAYNAWTAFCLADGHFSMQVTAWIIVACLLLVASGFFPRYTSILHFYLTFSLSTVVRLPDGGDEAAKLVAFFLVLICLADGRRNHWQTKEIPSVTSSLMPVAWAAWIGIRAQFAWIYLSAAVGKVSVPEWQDGTAVYYVTRQAFFGYNGPLSEFALWLTSVPLVTLVATWGTIVLEMVVAVFLLLPRRYRLIAVALSLLFHTAIILGIGLFSFGLIMIAGMLLPLLPDFNDSLQKLWSHGSRQKLSSNPKKVEVTL